jgi:NitT/TauT family transport system substrate-binding protein
MTRRSLLLQALLGSAGLLLPRAARAQQDTTLEVGMVGAISMTHWPVLVGLNNGYYAKQHIKLDLINIASSQGVMQQLAAGSLQLTISAGLTDPIYAIDKGAPIRIIRVEVQSPPYEINAKQTYTKLEDLKGKTVMIDSPKGITRIYLERMLAAHHIDPKDLDYVYAGATGARYNSLRAGAIDATILLPPFCFEAEDAGFNNLGLIADYAGDLPFTGAAVNTDWASKNQDVLKAFLIAHNESVQWLLDPNNRQSAIDLMAAASKMKPDVISRTYDFLIKKQFFEPTGNISKKKLGALIGALSELGDLTGPTDVERFVMPGVAHLTD